VTERDRAPDAAPEAAASDLERLARGYRRLLMCYPKAFRREHQEEILAVLLALSAPGQRYPSPAESANLVRNALWMRLVPAAPRSPRTVTHAVRLMYLGAVLELAALVTIVVSAGAVQAAIVQRYPAFTAAQWHAVVVAHLIPDEVAAPLAVGLWLWMAWANGRGHAWARVVFTAFFGLSTLGLLVALAQDAAVYATADLIAGVLLWLVQGATLALIFSRRSDPHYGRKAPPPHRGFVPLM
jgi:hypothetical protein